MKIACACCAGYLLALDHTHVSSGGKGQRFKGVGLSSLHFNTPPFMLVKMESESDPQAKIQELEKQVAALKKDNTKLKNEMRFNLEQEKFAEFRIRLLST